MKNKDCTVDEDYIFSLLDKSHEVLLIEPPYKRQYIPIPLGKITSYIKGNGGNAEYSRGTRGGKYDLICITSLFTTDSKVVLKTIKECKQSLFLRNIPILLGGIFASLMPEYIYEKTGVKPFVGYSRKLDTFVPDYTIDYGVEGFFKDASITFTTRGCPNKCPYCMVWRMEPEFYVEPIWKKQIIDEKPISIISDNSFLSAPIEHVREVVSLLVDKGKKVIFNNGLNCRMIDDEIAKLLSTLTYIRQGLRLGFDRMEDDGHYQRAMEVLIRNGCKVKGSSYTYVLFNFDDKPQEAYYRAREAWRYGSNPYLMRFRPLNKLSHSDPYIGKYWTENLIRAFSNYGQNFGYNRGDKTFESWIKGREGIDGKWKYKSTLTDEDWEAWYRK